MIKTLYICDCCGAKVDKKGDLTNLDVYSEFKDMQDNDYPYDSLDICKGCKSKIEKVVCDTVREIQSKNNKFG